MTGTKGMKHTRNRTNATRIQLWRSITIFRHFTLAQLCASVPGGASYHNARKFVAGLVRHGYAAKNGPYTGGRAGEHQQYRLLRDPGPAYPTVCERCGQPLAEPCLFLAEGEKKETDKQKQTDTPERGGEINHDAA